MIPKELLDVLVCPACRTSLTLAENGASLHCSSCQRAYPVRDGIPVLLIEEARTESSST